MISTKRTIQMSGQEMQIYLRISSKQFSTQKVNEHFPCWSRYIPHRIGLKRHRSVWSKKQFILIRVSNYLRTQKINNSKLAEIILNAAEKEASVPNTLCKWSNIDSLLLYSTLTKQSYTDGLAEDCGNSLANALELPQSCAEPSIQYMYL